MLFEGRVGVGEQVFPRAGRLLLERDGGDGAPCSIGLPLLPLEERVHAMRVEYAAGGVFDKSQAVGARAVRLTSALGAFHSIVLRCARARLATCDAWGRHLSAVSDQ